MRFITLVTYCIINTSLLVYSDSSYAAAKADKKNSTPHSTAKHHSKRSAKTKVGPTDVWERVRAEMQIPRPSPVSLSGDSLTPNPPPKTSDNTAPLSKPDLATTKPAHLPDPDAENITGQQDITSKPLESEFDNTNSELIEAKYTELGLRKLHPSKEIKPSITCTETAQAVTNTETRTPGKRIHTRIDFNPGLQDHRTHITSTAFNATGKTSVNPAFPIKLTSPCQQHVTKNNLTPPPENKYAIAAPALPIQEQLSEQDAAILAQQAANYERVNKFTLRYAQQTGYLQQVAERARPYLFHVAESLRQYKLPSELALLPIVESSYQPTALSPKSAAGLWQFIPSTGEEYNLKQTESYDERLDITASTNAAMRYLAFLNQHFNGNWLLAIAAYNCGPGRVDNAIQQNKSNGLNTDYWSLQLPEETQDYVPRLLALATIFADPGTYNLKLNRIKNEPYFVRVKIDRDIDIKNLANKDLQAVAELANLNLEQFTLLNPGFINSKLSNENSYTLLMPGTNANQLHQRLDMLAELVTSNEKATPSYAIQAKLVAAPVWQTPTLPFLTLDINHATPPVALASTKPSVVPKKANIRIHQFDKGQTLASIAKQYQITIEEILVANKFARNQNLAPGQQLIIPIKRKNIA